MNNIIVQYYSVGSYSCGDNLNIFCESLKPLSIRLDNSDGNMSGFTRMYIPHNATFPCMYPADYVAPRPIFPFFF